MRLWILMIAIIIAAAPTRAAERRPADTLQSGVVTTGSLTTDVLAMSDRPLEMLAEEGKTEVRHKSPFLAAAFSAVLPGAGEFYAESYWKTAIFAALEAVLWTVDISYNHKGDKQTDLFQNYADTHWSEVRYAEWINANLASLNPALDPAQYTIPINPNTTLRPWERVNRNDLNRTEQAIGGGFSHSLAPYGDQQYYEMIGKYLQFVHGWDSTNFNVPTYLDQVTSQLTWYAGQRGKANDYYNTASTAVTIIVLNHFLSALDAAWSAHSYNKIHTEVGMGYMKTPGGIIAVPTVRFSIAF